MDIRTIVIQDRELLEEFARTENDETSPESSGFFAKVKEFFGDHGN